METNEVRELEGRLLSFMKPTFGALQSLQTMQNDTTDIIILLSKSIEELKRDVAALEEEIFRLKNPEWED